MDNTAAGRGNARALGSMIRTHRKRRQWPQAGLARVCGTTASFISRVEAGNRLPSGDVLERIVRALNMGARDRQAAYHLAGYVDERGDDALIHDVRYLLTRTDIPPDIQAAIRRSLEEIVTAYLMVYDDTRARARDTHTAAAPVPHPGWHRYPRGVGQ